MKICFHRKRMNYRGIDSKMQEEFKTVTIYIGPNKGGISRNGMKE